MKSVTPCIVLCILFFFSLNEIAFTQPTTPIFRNYTVNEGLPQNSINCIHQDRHGFMWFGTQDGLCRFDGFEFKVFRHDPLKKNSLSNNYIWDIHEDEKGNLWISSFGGGLSLFNPDIQQFQHFTRESDNDNSLSHNNTFHSVCVNEAIWVGTNDGLCKIHIPSGEVNRYLQIPGNVEGHTGNFINPVVFQHPNLLWMGSDSGLTRLNIETDKFDFFSESPFDEKLPLMRIQDILLINDRLLVTTAQYLVELDFKNKKMEVLLNSSTIASENSIRFMNILPSEAGGIWLGSNNGLIHYNREKKQATVYRHNKEDGESLPHNYITSLFRSRNGIVWIGTRNGLAKLDREKSEFQLVRRHPEKQKTLSHNSIKGITEDENDLIWVATVDGLNAYDRKSGNFTLFKHQNENPKSLSSNYLLSLALDEKSTLWVGTRGGGLNKLIWDRNKPLHTAFFQSYRLGEKSIQSILNDGEILWLGSSGSGLIRFEKRSGKTKIFERSFDGSGPSHSYVYDILKDSRENYWIGTATGGLNLFNPKNERFLYFRNANDNLNSLGNNLVLCIFEDSQNQLWVGTSGGLSKFKYPLEENLFEQFQSMGDLSRSDLFQNFGRRDGLPNEVIYGILEDDNGFLWLSTNGGLAKFDPGLGKVVKVYDSNDGLQSNEHNQNAFFKNKKGELYFGGVGGFNIFHPDSLKGNLEPPPVHIIDFRLYNESVPLKSDSMESELQLTKVPHLTEQIELAYHHDVISFSFVALNYINPNKNQYRYQLKGFSDNWIEADNNRLATFTNLDAGEYTFRLKASNNDGVWNESGASLKLIVSPPPWKTWYAYLTYILFLTAGVYWFLRQRIKAKTRKLEIKAQIEKARSEERENFRKKTSHDFHDEAGNKLTKINLLTELARAETNGREKLREYLGKIEQNTKELSAGMRDFIWTMDSEKDNLFDTLLRLKDFGYSMFTDSAVKFSIIGLQTNYQNVKLPMDFRRAIMQIFKEAMNNSAKYAKAEHVTLSANHWERELEISITDDGIGFNPDEEKLQKGYGLKIMKERAQKIGGKLEVISSRGKGTMVRIKIKIPQMGNTI